MYVVIKNTLGKHCCLWALFTSGDNEAYTLLEDAVKLVDAVKAPKPHIHTYIHTFSQINNVDND